MTTVTLLALAQAGDEAAFSELTEPHLRELQVHCYRMLGSVHDAEDALQETLLTAWRGISGFEGRSSLRTWLYRIATNRCLNVRRAAGRRRAHGWDIPGVVPVEPSRLGDVVWLEPLPDALVSGGLDVPLGPEARYDQTEAVSLAFVTALQMLPPRQIAVLILRDVLGFSANDTADMMDSTLESVTSALKRARSSVDRRRFVAGHDPAPTPRSPAEQQLLSRFVVAYEAADIEAVVELLTDDVFISMPPMPFEYAGRGLVATFCARLFDAGRRFELVPTRANGQPAYGVYLRGADGAAEGVGVLVLTLAGGRICAMTRFERPMLAWFALPWTLVARSRT